MGDILLRINKIPVELLVVDGTAVGAIRLAMVSHSNLSIQPLLSLFSIPKAFRPLSQIWLT